MCEIKNIDDFDTQLQVEDIMATRPEGYEYENDDYEEFLRAEIVN